MDESQFWGDDKGILRSLWNPNVRNSVHKSFLLDLVLRQLNLSHTLTPNYYNIL
jgi:hypothetical protein